MASKKSSAAAAPQADEDREKAALQRRMEEARDDITQTVADIKETVTNKYDAVKESVTDALDWREQFRKHSAAWSLGALALGYVVGSAIASSLTDTKKKKGRRNDGFFAELAVAAEAVSEELSGMAQTFLLPLLVNKMKATFGIDLSEKLLARKPAKRRQSSRKPAKKAPTKRGTSLKSRAGKRMGAGKSATKKARS